MTETIANTGLATNDGCHHFQWLWQSH